MQSRLPAPGASVWIRRERWRVTHAGRDGSVVRVDVEGHDRRRRTFLAPFDRVDHARPLTRPRRVRLQHALASLAALASATTSVCAPSALVDARVAILPHQIEPALAILAGQRRVLVADDVGLGKTIQAGLVLAELARRRPSLSALVLVPATLIAQWREELDTRFGLSVLVASSRGLSIAALGQARGSNPWTRRGVWLASPDFVKQPHVVGALPSAPWDIVVIDEAHDVCGESARHDACARLTRRARHVVLLTATPHSGDAARFARLTELGRLDGIHDELAIFRRTRAAVGIANGRRVRWHRVRPTGAERTVLATLAAYEAATLAAAGGERRDAAMLLLSVFRKRALSSMFALDRSIARRLTILERSAEPAPQTRQLALTFDGVEDDVDAEDAAALGAQTGLRAADERAWLGRLRLQAETAVKTQSKIARLVRLARRTTEPVVVFTEFRHSLEAVVRALAHGRREVTAVHGGLTAVEREHAIARFLSGAASVLVATDVAGQGLNLHPRARWIVSLELPWNPARLEQRIGRVDRIGQRRPVHATLLVARHDAEAGVLSRLAARVLTARTSIGADALADIAPPAPIDVARSLIGGAGAVTGPAAAVFRACVRWQRAGRAVAHELEGRRRLRKGSQRPVMTGARPRLARLRRRVPLADGRALMVVSVPLMDGTGAVVEVHRFVIPVDGKPSPAFLDSASVRTAIRQRLNGRVARVGRWLSTRRDIGLSIERAVAGELCTQISLAAIQPGLFTTQPVREFESAQAQAEAAARRSAAAMEEWALRAVVELGAPTVEVLLWPPA